MQSWAGGLASLGDTLVRFAHLESVVLETSSMLSADETQGLLNALREASGVEVQHRTCDQAHKLALEAKKNSAHFVSAAPLSPFWCLERYALSGW